LAGDDNHRKRAAISFTFDLEIAEALGPSISRARRRGGTRDRELVSNQDDPGEGT
jgi:hypothetical protein